MAEYQAVWDVASASQDAELGPWVRLVAGVVMTGLAVVGIAFRNRFKGRLANAGKSAVLLLFIALLWTAFHAYFLFQYLGEREQLVALYETNAYESVEGVVQVLHEQPRSGHDQGDIVKIGEQQFEINYYRKTHAYRTTLAHGGVLRDGVTARVGYVNDEILAIEIAR